jgi:Tfp pilus assembly protein PilO
MLVDKITQINRSHRRVLLVALAVIASVGLYRWILAPYQGQLLAAQRYESALDGALNKAGILGTTLEEKKSKLEELTKKSERLRNEVFTANEVREFFASLQNTVCQAGCVIQSVSEIPDSRSGEQNQAEDGSNVVARKAVVTIVGGYNNIIEFLKKLRTSERKVWIESVRMDAGGDGKLKCQAVLTLYCINRVETPFYE